MENESKLSLSKKVWLIVGLTVDAAITIFLFVISIIMIIKSSGLRPEEIAALEANNLINYLIKNPPVYLGAFVIPLFVLLIANIVFLVLYVKKSSKKQEVTVKDLNEEQLEALKQELLNDITKKDEKK